MKENSNMRQLNRLVFILPFSLAMLVCGAASQASGLNAVHDLRIELLPEEAKLIGRDDIAIKTAGSNDLVFGLSERSTQVKVEVDGRPRDFEFKDGRLLIHLAASEANAQIQVGISYAGIFDDPVPTRPLNTDNPGYGVTGTISAKGCFLLAGAGWYPELLDSRATYRVSVSAPAGMVAVTAGRSRPGGSQPKTARPYPAGTWNTRFRG